MEKKTETTENTFSCPGKTGTDNSASEKNSLDTCPYCGLRFSDPRQLLVHVFHCHPT